MSIAGVTRELLVRYLDSWAPAALHGAKRATFAQVWAGEPDAEAAEAALRVFGEFADRLRGRRLAVVLIAPGAAALSARLSAVPAPGELAVHAVDGGPELLPAVLKAAGAAAAPLFAYIDTETTDATPPLTAVAGGKPGEEIEFRFVGDPAGEIKQKIKLPAMPDDQFRLHCQTADGVMPAFVKAAMSMGFSEALTPILSRSPWMICAREPYSPAKLASG